MSARSLREQAEDSLKWPKRCTLFKQNDRLSVFASEREPRILISFLITGRRGSKVLGNPGVFGFREPKGNLKRMFIADRKSTGLIYKPSGATLLNQEWKKQFRPFRKSKQFTPAESVNRLDVFLPRDAAAGLRDKK
jgi:hypothetical protein